MNSLVNSARSDWNGANSSSIQMFQRCFTAISAIALAIMRTPPSRPNTSLPFSPVSDSMRWVSSSEPPPSTATIL